MNLTPESLLALRTHLCDAISAQHLDVGEPSRERGPRLEVRLLAATSDEDEPVLELRARLSGQIVDLCRISGESVGIGWDQLGERFEIDLRDSDLFPAV